MTCTHMRCVKDKEDYDMIQHIPHSSRSKSWTLIMLVEISSCDVSRNQTLATFISRVATMRDNTVRVATIS